MNTPSKSSVQIIVINPGVPQVIMAMGLGEFQTIGCLIKSYVFVTRI